MNTGGHGSGRPSLHNVQVMGFRASRNLFISGAAAPLALLMTAALVALLALNWAKFAYDAWLTLPFPGSIEYIEGLIWQQAKLIPGPRMYADFQQSPPFISFEYPPVYPLLVHGIASLGVPWLVAGRLLSMLSGIAIALLTAAIVRETYESAKDHPEHSHAPLIGAVVAGMIVVMFRPFQFWSYVMRVDMLAVSFELLGMYVGLLSLRRPRLVYASALIFVVALYTKQNTLAGLLATFGVLVLHSPARALRAAALGLVVGLAIFAGLAWVTHGGFVRHTILYDANRFTLQRALHILAQTHFLRNHAAYLVISLIAAVSMVLANGRQSARQMPPGYLLALLYFLLTSASSVEMGKVGANDNYLISFVAGCALLIGLAIERAVHWRRSGQPVALLVLSMALLLQAIAVAPIFGRQRVVDPEYRREYAELIEQTRRANKPVLSDDMVLLMQAGKEIPWEPGSITELSAQRLFDEKKLVSYIERHELAFAVVTGSPGRGSFDEWYSPAVASALSKNYPIERKLAGMRVLEPVSAE